MSFATNVKNEICGYNGTKTEKIALLSGFIRNNGIYDEEKISLITENASVAKKIYTLIKEIYDVNVNITQKKGNKFTKNSLFLMNITDKVNFILEDISITKNNNYLSVPNQFIISDEPGKRSYLLGCFLSKGSVNDPKTSRYHLEFLIENYDEAEFISELLNEFDLNSKVLSRDKGFPPALRIISIISMFAVLAASW